LSIIIQKFGGSLLETPDHIRRAADYIIRTKIAGEDPVVVVSASGSTTDHLLRLAREINESPDEREMDMLLSVGERTAMALLAMAINADGRCHAVSFTGSQVGIITDTRHTDARILEVKCLRIKDTLDNGQIPIVAGFQGVSTEREITTLGRGGSDSTAVALAAALKAESCQLIKESGAVHSADPELVAEAVKLPQISYDTLETITSAGAKIVQPRAASLAKEHKVKLSVKDTGSGKGTLISDRSLETSVLAAVVIEKGKYLQTGDDAVLSVFENDNIVFAFSRNDLRLVVAQEPIRSGRGTKVSLLSVIAWSNQFSGKMGLTLLNALAGSGVLYEAWTVEGGIFSVLVKDEIGHQTLNVLHRACLDEGYIKRNDMPD